MDDSLKDGENPDESRRDALIELHPEWWRSLTSPYRIVALILCLAGAIAVLFGWWGAAGTLDPSRQLPYIASGGIGGMFLLGLGTALFFSIDLSETRRELSDAREDIRSLRILLENERAAQDHAPASTDRARLAAKN